MRPNILIDMVNTTVFKESEWIGVNKEYHNVPTHVSNAKYPWLSVSSNPKHNGYASKLRLAMKAFRK